MLFYHYRILSDKILPFCRPTFDGVVKTVFLVSIRTLSGETFFRAKTMFFFKWLTNCDQKPFFFLSKTFQWVCPHCILSVQRNILKEKIFSQGNWVFDRFRTMSEMVLLFYWFFFRTVVKTAFFVSLWKKMKRSNFFEETVFFLFSKFERNILGVSSIT